ncbi:MBL fold metallo-hydrolase [Blautia schinkii]|nr:MBL fold metallo-hydrolase [Blautia schinkii]
MLTYGNLSISLIRSGKGDCIHLRFMGSSGYPHNVIIDTGSTSTAGEFRKLYNDVIFAGEVIDTLFISHYDDDHIGGILKLVESGIFPQIKSVYFNAYSGGIEPVAELTAMQGQRLFHSNLYDVVNSSVTKGDVICLDGAVISVIGPSQDSLTQAMSQMKKADASFIPLAAISDWKRSFDELRKEEYPAPDISISNKSSIVFILTYEERNFLFCGDAPASEIAEGLRDIDMHKFDLVKLPHHGSCRNISKELLELIEADSFMICADGKSHPDKHAIAKLLDFYGTVLIYSNYSWWMNGFLQHEDIKYIENRKLVFKCII